MKVDFISQLPPEISQMILRHLDPVSLLRAAQVSRRWLQICKSDRRLRENARNYLRLVERGWTLPEDILENCIMHDLYGWLIRIYM